LEGFLGFEPRVVKLIGKSAGYTLAFALQLREKHGKTSVRVAEECQLALKTEYTEQNIHNDKNK